MSKTIMQRLRKGEDLVTELTRVCRENGITRGSIQVIGAMERASLGYYHQDTREYETHAIDHHVEILAGIGNVSLLDGETFVHLHLTLGDDKCRSFGGHAMTGNIIFAAEAVIAEIPGDALNRVYDEPTGLKLWG
jgi:predicted DNA-binding protein with PD1-like motif